MRRRSRIIPSAPRYKLTDRCKIASFDHVPSPELVRWLNEHPDNGLNTEFRRELQMTLVWRAFEPLNQGRTSSF